jgi:methylmalonyl-CoA/ethylmalonyl-CoA epimerase
LAPPFLSNRLRLHHVGFIVADIAASAPGFAGSLGASWDGRIFEDPLQKAKVTFIRTHASDAAIELVEPAAEDSPVRRFLSNRGGGLHHVCYEVEDLDRELPAMRSRRSVIASRPKPAVAFDGRRIAWVITAEGLLVELLESAIAGERVPAGDGS